MIKKSKSFDFTFHPTSVNRTSDAVSGQGCGVLQCREMMPGGPADSRKILSLAVYTRGSSLDSQSRVWERLARVTAQSPREVKVSDAKHISGSLSDTAAQLRVTLHKASDCTSMEFSCVAKLGDDNGQKSEMKSVIRGSNLGLVEDSNLEPGVDDDGDLYGQSSEQSAIVRKVEHFMVKLSEKLKCIESRFSDSRDRDDKLEDKLEDLQGKISRILRDRAIE
ncbi:hypothetical protein EGW08_007915 [Elysia chlorotica]|uniref:Uncharacterized protein n=1 Tax=Elysia chlorotica TaxID=188477 RepID=A0A3S1BML4_ELYCH|nr:hypothetical protein EGW08_007915 [Elysia chlorotica]